MTWLRNLLVLTLAVLWLPMPVHCQLEQIPALNFLSCCPDENATPHQDADCETDGCAVVESGHYKTEERLISLPAPELFLAASLTGMLATTPSASEPSFKLSPGGSIPPELPRVWQFLFRAALPPRAPSFAS